MDITTPEGFWNAYKKAIHDQSPTQRIWKDIKEWTKITKNAAIAVINSQADLKAKVDKQRLYASKEYFRIDVIGEEKLYLPNEDKSVCNWLLKIAFEHENGKKSAWKQELCKLTHVVADLKVLAGFHDSSKIEEELNDRIEKMETCLDSKGQPAKRISRLRNSKWLFIFASLRDSKEVPRYKIFSLDPDKKSLKVVQIDCEDIIPIARNIAGTV